jgi:hypothetical protein
LDLQELLNLAYFGLLYQSNPFLFWISEPQMANFPDRSRPPLQAHTCARARLVLRFEFADNLLFRLGGRYQPHIPRYHDYKSQGDRVRRVGARAGRPRVYAKALRRSIFLLFETYFALRSDLACIQAHTSCPRDSPPRSHVAHTLAIQEVCHFWPILPIKHYKNG